MLAVLSIFFGGKKVWHFFMALSLADLLEEGSDGGWTGNGNLYKYMQGGVCTLSWADL